MMALVITSPLYLTLLILILWYISQVYPASEDVMGWIWHQTKLGEGSTLDGFHYEHPNGVMMVHYVLLHLVFISVIQNVQHIQYKYLMNWSMIWIWLVMLRMGEGLAARHPMITLLAYINIITYCDLYAGGISQMVLHCRLLYYHYNAPEVISVLMGSDYSIIEWDMVQGWFKPEYLRRRCIYMYIYIIRMTGWQHWLYYGNYMVYGLLYSDGLLRWLAWGKETFFISISKRARLNKLLFYNNLHHVNGNIMYCKYICVVKWYHSQQYYCCMIMYLLDNYGNIRFLMQVYSLKLVWGKEINLYIIYSISRRVLIYCSIKVAVLIGINKYIDMGVMVLIVMVFRWMVIVCYQQLSKICIIALDMWLDIYAMVSNMINYDSDSIMIVYKTAVYYYKYHQQWLSILIYIAQLYERIQTTK